MYRWLNRVALRVYRATLPKSDSVTGTCGADAETAHVRWLWNDPDTAHDVPPVLALELRRAAGTGEHITRVALAPSQAANLCRVGRDAVRDQCRAFGDVGPLGLPEPRDYDVRPFWRGVW